MQPFTKTSQNILYHKFLEETFINLLQLLYIFTIIIINMIESESEYDQPFNDIFELILIILGVVSVELYFLSPLIPIIKYKLNKCEINHIPFLQILCNLINCASYIVSGINLNDKQQLICNLLGLIISLSFTITLWIFYTRDPKYDTEEKGNKIETVIYLFMLFNIVFQVFYFLNKVSKINQLLACILNVLMYAAGFVNVYEAYKEKNADIIPWQGSICGLVSSVIWICYSMYGMIKGKLSFAEYYPSLIGNSLSFLVLMGIIGVFWRFKKDYKKSAVKVNESLFSISSYNKSKKESSNIQGDDEEESREGSKDSFLFM